MTETESLVVWLIDEDEHQLRTYRAMLEKAIPSEGNIEVKGIKAYPKKVDYLEVLNDPRTASIIIDQRLKETGEADYTGIELAQFLRSINDKLPIYILTNYPEDEMANGDWSVEDVISKEEIGKKDRQQVIVARLLRRISVHQVILGEREQRFRALLKKSLDSELNEKEQDELNELRFARISAIAASEEGRRGELEDTFKKMDLLLSKFSRKPSDLE